MITVLNFFICYEIKINCATPISILCVLMEIYAESMVNIGVNMRLYSHTVNYRFKR